MVEADVGEDDHPVTRYVQFAASSEGIRAEAVSNNSLEGTAKLDVETEQQLVSAGWFSPARGRRRQRIGGQLLV